MVAPYPAQAGWSAALIYSLSQETFALSGGPCLCLATTPTIHGVGDLQLHLYLLTSRGGTEKAGGWPTSTHSIHFASLHGAQAPVPLPRSPKQPLPGDLSSPSDCACHSTTLCQSEKSWGGRWRKKNHWELIKPSSVAPGAIAVQEKQINQPMVKNSPFDYCLQSSSKDSITT